MSDSTVLRRVTKLSPSGVKAYLPRLWESLGEKDQDRLKLTVDLFEHTGDLQLSQVLEALFPDKPVVVQLTSFRQLRARLTEAAESCGVPLRLTTDTRKRSAPARRRCWFVRVDSMAARVSAGNQRLIEEVKYVASLAVRGGLEVRETPTGEPDSRKRVIAIDLLNAWLNGADQPHLAALLGDVGIGKTTTCKYWTAVLSERRAKDARAPLPIYFNLRALAAEAVRGSLSASLEGHLKLLTEAQDQGLSPQDVLHYVRNEGALVIFDGLDEVLVHLLQPQANAFVRQLISILPPQEPHPLGQHRQSRAGHVLFTCRTHYFRTLREQDAFLFGGTYSSTRGRAIEAFLLLPFDDQQVREYLGRTFDTEQATRYLEFIKEVHNLGELAVRPLLLGLICEQLQLLEEQRMRGEPVNGATLYRNCVKSWLERDQNKHQILPAHKQILMEELAAELTRRDSRSGWKVDRVEQWLVDLLDKRPAIKAHYPHSPIELLKEDLRTATFIVREGEDHFHFAHKSLQEFFLACYLERGLIEWDFERWEQLPWPGRETLIFLRQLLHLAAPEHQVSALAAFKHLRDTFHGTGKANLLAFRYGLLAHQEGDPVASLAGFQLQHADLRQLKISGKRRPLNLDRVCMRGAKLDGAIFECASLEDADFSDASLAGAEFHECRLVAASFARASLLGTLFRQSNASDARFADAQCHRTQWLHCQLPPKRELSLLPERALFAQCTPPMEAQVEAPAEALEYDVFDGHIAEVRSVAFSPDSRLVASGSADATIKLWDAVTSQCLRTLRGHRGSVNTIAFLDGGRLVSGAADGALRVWDIVTGHCLDKMVGHQAAVNCVACSPDGKYLLSGSDDGSIRLWDVGDSECLLTLIEHTSAVTTVAFTADGTQFLSGAKDRWIRVWDLATGHCHNGIELSSAIVSASFCPHKKAKRVLLGLADGTLQMLDAISGQYRHEISAAKRSVLSTVFSPDGDRMLSGGRSGELALWEAVTCEKIFSAELVDPINSVAFSRVGPQLIAAAGNRIELYRIDEGHLRTFCAHWSRIESLQAAPDGRRLLCRTEDETILLLDLLEGVCIEGERERRMIDDQESELTRTKLHDFLLDYPHWKVPIALKDIDLGGARYSLRSSQALDRSDRRFSLDVEPNLESLTIDGDGNCVTSMAWCSLRQCVLLGQRNGSIALWALDTRECLIEFKQHTASIVSVAFSADGTLAVSICEEGVAKIWDISRGACLHTFQTLLDDVTAVRFLNDGRMMIAGIAEVALWDLAAPPREVLRIRSFGKGSFAWWRPGEPQSLQWTGEAWRWLGVLARTAQTHVTERFPIEASVDVGIAAQDADVLPSSRPAALSDSMYEKTAESL